MEIIIAVFFIVLTSLLIWKSGEGFEKAADYLGRNLSDGVKGATINAIGSSLPELITTIFFLFILRNAEGFASGLGTTAGSAIFNAIVIPFIVGITSIKYLKTKKANYSKKVLWRDGISLIIIDIVLLVLIKSGGDGEYSLGWGEGLFLMSLYFVYLAYLFLRMDKSQFKLIHKEKDVSKPAEKIDYLKALINLDLARIIIGNRTMTSVLAWSLLFISMAIMSFSCYTLVESSIHLSESVGVPLYIVSVLIAAAATSVPDTYLSYKDAKKGNIDDSISNALGSNVFDIGFAIGFPVLIYGLIHGDVLLTSDIEKDLSELLIVLLVLTLVVFILLVYSRKITKNKVYTLGMLYVLFVLFIISKVMNVEFMSEFFELLYKLSSFFEVY